MRTILTTACLFFTLFYVDTFAASLPQQILVVTASGTNSIDATLQRYERQTSNQHWQPIGRPIQVVVGKNGVTNHKLEGDLKTPLGEFNIISAFGFSAKLENKILLPYRHIDNNSLCVDDSNSRFYNQIIEMNIAKPNDWSSGEKMDQFKNAYQLGLLTDYNTKPSTPFKGSCIFIHVWQNARTGTAGCIAMSKKNMREILNWLNEKSHPKIKIQINQ